VLTCRVTLKQTQAHVQARSHQLIAHPSLSAAMLVSINLDHPHSHYTNLDVINGRVQLRVPNPGTISSIVVKLEGESRTRLLQAVRPDRPDKQKPVLEVHKVGCKGYVPSLRKRLTRNRFCTRHKLYGLQINLRKRSSQDKRPHIPSIWANTSTHFHSRYH
jgi:hypothetical protein